MNGMLRQMVTGWGCTPAGRRLALLAVLLALVALPLLAGADCAAATPGAPSLGLAAPVCGEVPDGIPYGPAPTLTEKPFWIVLGLVVVGWLVLAADWPEEKG